MATELVNTYIEGLNKDLSNLKNKQSTLQDGKNIRVLTESGSSSFAISNVRGNEELVIIDAIDSSGYDRSDYVIIAAEAIRDGFVIFYANKDDSGYGIIDRLIYNNDETYTRIQIYKSLDLNTTLYFFPKNKMELVTNYETNNVIKIYWTNINYTLKLMNIAPKGNEKLEASYSHVQVKDVDSYSLVPNINFTSPKFKGYGGGKLLSGAIQYSYRLISLNGVKSSFSPLSDIIYLFQSGTTGLSNDILGTDTGGQNVDIESGKSVNLQINLNSTDYSNFDEIEIVSLWYSSATAIPTIKIIKRTTLSNTLNFTDDGGYAPYGTIELDEFLAKNINFSASQLAVKDNILFAANIKEEFFSVEFDARAYRYDDDNLLRLIHNGLEYDVTVIHGSNGVKDQFKIREDNDPANPLIDIPDTFDCINHFNLSVHPLGECNATWNGTTWDLTRNNKNKDGKLGGSGINVSYIFDTYQSEIYTSDLAQETYTNINNDNQEWVLGTKKGFTPNEIYRFGIVFFDKKGNSSFVNWIGDIKMPNIGQIDTLNELYIGYGHAARTISRETQSDENSKVLAKNVYPKFIVNTSGTDAYGLDYQIVYVPRKKHDKTVIGHGIVNSFAEAHGGTSGVGYNTQLCFLQDSLEYQNQNSTNQYSHGYWHPNQYIDGKLDVNNNLMSFISPDIIFDSNIENTDSLYLLKEGVYLRTEINSINEYDQTSNNSSNRIVKLSQLVSKGRDITTIEDFKILSATSPKSTIKKPDGSSLLVSMQKPDESYEGDYVYKTGKSMVLYADSLTTTEGQDDAYLASKYATMMVALMRQTISYGGNTYEDRLSNQYIVASDVVINAGIVSCTKGDTIISVFEHLRIIADPEHTLGNAGTLQHLVYFPVYSQLNNWLRVDQQYDKGGTYILDNKPRHTYLQEKGNITGDLYKYNDVYHKVDETLIYFPKPIDYVENDILDTIVKYSDVKLNGEKYDSWAIFRSNNFNEVDSNFGAIEEMIEFNDNIYIFQNSGISIASINKQIQTIDQTGANLVLGTGSALDRFDYLSTEIGVQNNNKVVKSLQALYWIDINKKKLYRLQANSISSLSDLKFLSGFFRTTLDEQSHLIGIYDNEYSEVLLSISNSNIELELVTKEITSTEVQDTVDIKNVLVGSEPSSYAYVSFVYNLDPTLISKGSRMEIITPSGAVNSFNNIFTYDDSGYTDANTIDISEGTLESYITNTVSAINAYLSANSLTSNYTVTTQDTNIVTITSNYDNSDYDMEITEYNNLDVNTDPEPTYNGSGGNKDITPTINTITSDNTVVVVDFYSGGGVDKVEISVNGAKVASSGMCANSNYGINGRFDNNYYPDNYVSGRVYTVGEKVNNSSADGNFTLHKTYKCIQETDGSQSYSDTDYWEEDTPYTISPAIYDINTIYYKYEYVKDSSNGEIYMCIATASIGSDLSSTTSWLHVVNPQEYNSTTTYNVGDKVNDPSLNLYATCIQTSLGNSLNNSSYWDINQYISHAYNYPLARCQDSVWMHYQAFIGTNSKCRLNPFDGDIGVTDNIPPDRISEYENDVDVAYHIPKWAAHSTTQRVWAKLNAGDVYNVNINGSGTLTGWNARISILSVNTSDLASDSSGYIKGNEIWEEQEITGTIVVNKIEYIEKYEVTSNSNANYIGLLIEYISGSITHSLTFDTVYNIFQEGVIYTLNGAEFEVINKDSSNLIYYLRLVSGTPILGNIDLTEYIQNPNDYTIVFNEFLDKFVSFYTFLPDMYLKGNKSFYSSFDSNVLWKHNSGLYGQFYGKYYDSTFDIIVNAQGQALLEYNNLSWFSEVSLNENVIDNETIYSIKVYNDYQESDEIILFPMSNNRYIIDTSGYRIVNNGITDLINFPENTLLDNTCNIRNNINHWRTQIPRFRSNEDDKEYLLNEEDPTSNVMNTTSDRFRSPYIRIRFKLKSGENKRYTVYDMTTLSDIKLL